MSRPTPARGAWRVAVLAGGANTERNVSLSSGRAVARALRGLGHAVALVDSASAPVVPDEPPEQAFLTTDPDEASSPRPDAPTAASPPDLQALARVRTSQIDGVLAPGRLPVLQHADVVFVTVFGDEGESGATQRYLARWGLRYTGPGPEVCALTFDKLRTARCVAEQGIEVPASHLVRREHRARDLDDLTIPPPWIVKPVAGGSTIGLSRVETPDGLAPAVGRASAEGRDALVEALVPGRDLTIGVLADRSLAPVEPVTDRELYDYTAKYTPGASHKQVPADLEPETAQRLGELALRAHRLLGVGDTSSRSDFRLTVDGRLVFLEINPLPGLTPTSSYPLSAAGAGLAFPELCRQLVLRALTGRD